MAVRPWMIADGSDQSVGRAQQQRAAGEQLVQLAEGVGHVGSSKPTLLSVVR